MSGFRPELARRFDFSSYAYDQAAGELTLDYRLDEHRFRERIVFRGARPIADGASRAALDRCFHLTHLMAGISYYKAALPPEIRIETRSPGARCARLLEACYRNGLGEFAYRNGLGLEGRARFPSAAIEAPAPLELTRACAVPLGGGKDSLVSCAALAEAGIRFRTLAVGQARLIGEVAERVGAPHIAIERHLDPSLFELNSAGAYNGHVPISAILACVMLAGALLYGYDTVVMSNERSAEEGNLTLADGFVVNHQYSKTLAFERAFADAVAAEVLPGFRYFSLLRSLSELAVARHFSALADYHAVFSSCNANFRLSGPRPPRWCRNCPKCRFVFLALAPFLERAALTRIFGGDLLSDPHQEAGYRALCGLDGAKPFECVGEVGECRAAIRALAADARWREAPLVGRLAAALEDANELDLEAWLIPGGEHRVPAEFRAALDALARA